MFVGDWMERGERYWPDATAVVDTGRNERFTYRELNARANRLAAWLRDRAGVREGDRVGLLALNGVEVLDVFFACAKLGAIFVPFNWRSHAQELAEVTRLCAPRVLVFGDDFREAADAMLDVLPSDTPALHIGGAGVRASAPYEPVASEGPAVPVCRARVDPEDICALLFTGGTTGLPKAARISLGMIAWNTLNTLVHEVTRGDVTITHTPMFHTGGLFAYTLPLLTVGGTVVIMRKWTADEMLELLERERVTLLFCVPTQYQMMLESPRFATTSFASLRFLTSGGAPLPVPVIHRYREVHGVAFKQGFGMTEFGPGAFSMDPADAERKAGSIGKPNYFVDARVVDDEGRPLPPGEAGELQLRGPMLCSGYFGNERASAEAVDEDGWFRTGDVARVDEEGFFFIVDRKKDMFVSCGENVYPVEIERVLYQHPAVAQCAVIGVPDEKWGESGLAVVVRKAGAEVTAEALLEHCRAHLARYKVPKHVRFVDALPVSAAGKILKRELRAAYAG